MRLADYFGRAFASVSSAQFPWLKTFKESTVAKLVDVSFACVWFIDSILNFCLKKRKRINGFNKASNFGDIEEKKGLFIVSWCLSAYSVY